VKVGNIYCVGRNYRLHALELGNEVPSEPMIFTKPTHALREINGGQLEIPKQRGDVHFELELVLHISHPYDANLPLEHCIDSFTLGLDLTLRDVQARLKEKGHPWLAAKGFKGAATVGAWQHVASMEQLQQGQFQLLLNGKQAQLGSPKDMIFGFEQLIAYIDQHYGLDAGDLIYTGTPAGVAALHSGDYVQMLWNDEELCSCHIV